MAETCMMSGETIIEPGGEAGFPCPGEEYVEIEVLPADELREIELSIIKAGKSGADLLPAVFILESCRGFAEKEMMQEYSDGCILLSALCRDLFVSGGGKLKPVGDYLGFYID